MDIEGHFYFYLLIVFGIPIKVVVQEHV